jgi:hypothetical protein
VASNATLFDGACFAMTPAQIAAWPDVTMVLAGGVTLPVSPSLYLIPMYNCAAGQVGMGIMPDPTFTIIGGNMFLRYAVMFDKDKMQVGFAPSDKNCD